MFIVNLSALASLWQMYFFDFSEGLIIGITNILIISFRSRIGFRQVNLISEHRMVYYV